MAADVRGAESSVDVNVNTIRQAQASDSADRAQVAVTVETPQMGEEQTATVIDLRTAEPIVEIDRLTDSGLAKASSLELGIKRAVDVVVSLVAMTLLAPLFVAVAAAIKLTSKGPVFFKQPRVGRLGEKFNFYKFRSMRTTAVYEKPQLRELNEKDGPIFKIKNDPRITKVGRVIRKLSIDELPQLAHVLSGKMSLVGPRPHLPEEVAAYDARAARRLDSGSRAGPERRDRPSGCG